jgi:hypothetical protein
MGVVVICSNISLGYAGFAGDIDAWKRFASEIFGLQAVSRDGELFLRADERAVPRQHSIDRLAA